MACTHPIPYTGSTPGADSNTYVLFTSTAEAALQNGGIQLRGLTRYVLSLKNSASGTLRAEGSNDGGTTWVQFFERALAAAPTSRANEVIVPVQAHRDVRVLWVNGGAAQATWYVAQALSDGTDGSVTTSSSPGQEWSIANTVTLVTNLVAKSSPGSLRSASLRVDATAPAGTYYVQLHDAAALPADTSVPFAVWKIQHTAGADDRLSIDCNEQGIALSTGIVFCISTTEATKTIGGAYLLFNGVEYR